MIDKDTGIFIAKIIAGIIALVLLFTVIIPKWEEIDNAFNENMRRFIGLIFDTGSSFKKNSYKEDNKYLVADFNRSKNNFIKQFLNVKTAEGIERTINLGNTLLSMEPSKIEIARDIAFLYYINKDYEKAMEYYETVLEDYPKRKRRFKYLKGENSRVIKRALLEMAAVCYEQEEIERMMDYYKQYLRASQRDDVYHSLVSQGIDLKTARFAIFNAIAGEGFFSYQKAIEQLEQFAKEYPGDKDVFYKLGLYNFDVVNLYAQDDFAAIQQNYYDAGIYFYKIFDESDDFRKRTITINLSKLDKFKAKYEKEQASSAKKE